VAHLTEGTLRRMVDDPDVGRADAAHLEGCGDCQSLFKSIKDDARSVASMLAVPDARVDVTRAYERLRSAPMSGPRLGFRLPTLMPRSRPMVLALAATFVAIAILAVVAQDFKTNIQPNSVTPVPITVADMQALSQLGDYGTVTWTTQPNLQVVSSAAEAASVAGGMQPPVVTTNLPKGISPNITYAAMPKAIAVFTFSSDKAAAAAAQRGKTLPKMPAGMDGAKLTVTVGPAVGEIFGELKQGSSASDLSLPLIVGKSAAPTATSTQVTVKQMEDVIMAQPGISPELKAAIKAIGNPSSTLPIPIPVGYATSRTVTVQGVQGVALGDNTGVGSGVVWVKNGVVYAVAGPIKQSDAIDIANNLK
jgi:hypothetical protein